MPTYNQESYEAGVRFAKANEELHANWERRHEPGFEIQPFIDEYNEAGTAFTIIENDMHAEAESFDQPA